MSSELHLVQLSIDAKRFARWSGERRLAAEDNGYAVHSLLCDAYGEYRLRPFSAEMKPGIIKVLGYSSVSAAEMQRVASEVAEPEVTACLLSAESKCLPSEWEVGRKLSFQIKIAPTRQSCKKNGKRRECDAFLLETDATDREAVYANWLASRVESAITIHEMEMVSFRLVSAVRRSTLENGNRPAKSCVLPDVTFCGTMEISDSQAFCELLRNGVGRHRAFGFGALFVRPSKPR